jgi:hypothetical protein
MQPLIITVSTRRKPTGRIQRITVSGGVVIIKVGGARPFKKGNSGTGGIAGGAAVRFRSAEHLPLSAVPASCPPAREVGIPCEKDKALVQARVIFTASAAIPRTIPIMEDIPILPVALLNRKRLTMPRTTVTTERITVRIPHERKPRIRLKKPNQFLFRFGAAAGTGAGAAAAKGAGTGAAVWTAG